MYILFLLFVVLISYGQSLFMTPWQDDHTLFFKLANIEGAAGYFGYGPLGEGVYKYIATFYLPIYKLFGHNEIFYYAYALAFYFLATVIVYKTFSVVLGKVGGRLASFLYAAGYVASDGFLRLFNTISTSISIIGISGLSYFYWKFYKNKKLIWYFFAVVAYFLTVELARIRTHYLIGVIFAFEIIFFTFKRFPRSAIASAARLVPFLLIFRKYFMVGSDGRSQQVKIFVSDLFSGQFHKLFSFFSAIANLAVPDRFLNIFSNRLSVFMLYSLTIFSLSLLLFFLIKKSQKRKLVFIGFLLVSVIWFFISRKVFLTPILNLSPIQIYISFLGGEIILFLAGLAFLLKKNLVPIYLFFSIWVLLNIGSYAIYDPTIRFSTYHRYLAHSFFPFTGLLATLFVHFRKRKRIINKIVLIAVVFYGLVNLLSSFYYQNQILRSRSFPIRSFYKQLGQSVPSLSFGDVLYFDVADDMRANFANAFSVASMPEETALAWRYGIDRYDIRRVTSFDDLVSYYVDGEIENINGHRVKINSIHSFFYSRDGLVDTSQIVNNFLEGGIKPSMLDYELEKDGDDYLLNLTKPIVSIAPNLVEFDFFAGTPDLDEIEFPMVRSARMVANKISKNRNFRLLAFEYLNYKNSFRESVQVKTTSSWRENVLENIIDGNVNTVWRPDRVLWGEGEGAALTFELPSEQAIDRLVWTNAHGNNTPTNYSIEVSLDGKRWGEVVKTDLVRRIDTPTPQVLKFDSVDAKYVRMVLRKSIGGDSPGISEVWIIPSTFNELDIVDAEEFLNDPFGYVADKESFISTFNSMEKTGSARVFWLSDKNDSWQTSDETILKIRYDGNGYKYKVKIPAGGTEITRIKLSDFQIPGSIRLEDL